MDNDSDSPADKQSATEESGETKETAEPIETSQTTNPAIASSVDNLSFAANSEEHHHQAGTASDETCQTHVEESSAPDTQVPGSQSRLHQARQNLIRNEVAEILSQVRVIERRLTKMSNVLMEQEQDLRTREVRAEERERWLRQREYTVLKRERNAKRREQEITDREEALSRAANAIPRTMLARFTPRFSGSSVNTQTPNTDQGNSGPRSWNRPSSPLYPSPGSPSPREQFMRDASPQQDTTTNEDGRDDELASCAVSKNPSTRTSLQHPVDTNAIGYGQATSGNVGHIRVGVSQRHSDHQASSLVTPAGTVSTSESPRRRSHHSLRRLLFPLTPRTPPPPYSSPSTVLLTGTSAPSYSAENFWSRARDASSNMIERVVPSSSLTSSELRGNKVQRHIEKLEREAKEAGDKLEKARKEERDKAIRKAREEGRD